MVWAKAPKYREGLAKAGDTLAQWGASLGLSDRLGQGQTGQYLDALGSAAGGIAQSVANAAGGLVLVVTFAMLAMSEAGAWKRKVRAQWGDHSLVTASTIATRCRSYVLTRTITSVLTGVLTGLMTWAVGLDLAFVWAVIAILLNYIPTLGSIIAIIPPSLLAYVQLGGPGALGVFAGLTVLQILIGNYLDPKLQGRSLQLSPFVLLFSIGLWGWVWGIGGALLAVPLTMTATVICSQFRQSRWIATLLAEDVEDVPQQVEPPPQKHDDGEPSRHAA